MDDALRWRLDAIIGLLSIIAAGVFGIAWARDGFVAAVTIFVLGAVIVAAIRGPDPEPAESGPAESGPAESGPAESGSNE